MIVKISNDDGSVTNVYQRTVEKVSAVQEISATRSHQENGNSLPDNTVTKEKLDEAIREVNENLQAQQRELHISVDEDTGQTVIKVTDLATNEVIRQIPNEEALNFARKLNEGAELVLFSEYI